jgi:hypothetical protein
MNITQEELNEILEYQIETIIRRETTYEFEIIDSPLVIIDGKQFIARTNTVNRIGEHQLTSKFNSIREELMNHSDSQYEMVDYSLTAMEFILSFLEEHKGKKIFIMGVSFNSGPSPEGTRMMSKQIRSIVI